jgi:hypothetical protein
LPAAAAAVLGVVAAAAQVASVLQLLFQSAQTYL